MRVIATSDLHGYLPERVDPCDLLLIAGDICPVWNHDLDYQAEWLGTHFNEWLKRQPAKHIVGVAGNHDFIASKANGGQPELLRELHWTYLDNESTSIPDLDVKIWGSPLSNKFGSWAFMKNESELAEIWRDIPRDVDILMTHGPAQGYGDLAQGFSGAKRGLSNLEHVGSISLANQLNYDLWPNLKLYVWGHIHEGYGEYQISHQTAGLNVAHVNDMYENINPPLAVTL